jgi:RNA polymerase sigma-70 factor (ECF subfamily)
MAPRRDPPTARSPARSNEEDLELARRCGSGDPAAQRAFVDRFAVLVHSICARSGIVGPDREDVAQQVLLDAFRALPRYRGTSRLSTWIYSLALRRVADHFRSPQRREVPSGWPGDDSFPPPQSTAGDLAPDEQAVRRDEDQRVNRALARVAEPERAVLLAYYLGEMSVTEISRTLEIPEGTVKTRLHRGRQMLRKELGTW